MKIVIAADKFKHSLSAFEVCDAIEQGLRKASPNFEVASLPLADGGDGLAEVLSRHDDFEKKSETVHDPLWRLVEADYLLSQNKQIAFVEMAQASGLRLLQPTEFDPSATTSFGTGELIKCALDEGTKKLIIGIGGSATNDCGIGIAAALGYRFLDEQGRELEPVGRSLSAIQTIDDSAIVDMQGVEIQVAADVTNPLVGDNGTTRVYGPQKGATPEMVEWLETGVQKFAALIKDKYAVDVSNLKGSGAAGGVGAGCVLFLNAGLISGAELVIRYSGAEQHIQKADAVITGEGKIDSQTWNGKLVDAVTRLCAKHQKPVIALCGTLALSADALKANGLTAAFSIVNKPMTEKQALGNAYNLLRDAAYNVGCLLRKD